MSQRNTETPDTKEFRGKETKHALSAIPDQQKTRVTNRPHTTQEDDLPPGNTDIRGVKREPSSRTRD